jgi:DNA-binding MarR family transcriptional regulator
LVNQVYYLLMTKRPDVQVTELHSTNAVEGQAMSVDSRSEARRQSLLHPMMAVATDFRDGIRQGLLSRGHQLQPSHSSVLVYLKLEGSRLTDLAERAGVSKQAMGKIIDELEEIGYVEKGDDPVDGRAKMIRFTSMGMILLRDSADIVNDLWNKYAELLGEERLQRFRDDLFELQAKIQDSGQQAGQDHY